MLFMLTWQSMVDKKQYLTMFCVSKINFKVKVIERTVKFHQHVEGATAQCILLEHYYSHDDLTEKLISLVSLEKNL